MVQDPGKQAGADHAGLVDDQDRVAAESWRPGVGEVDQQPADGVGLDAGAVGQLLGRLGGQRRADHLVAGCLPDGPGGIQCEGLARPGVGVDQLDAVARGGQVPDHGHLIGL
jgi:hypothetical protein